MVFNRALAVGVFGLVGLAAILHFWVATSTGLTTDEAHYLLYARFLDWSYFDHPPLVGWVQAPLVSVTSNTGVLRLLPQFLWLGSAWLVWRLTLAISEDLKAAAWAVVLFAASPILNIHGMALLPDSLLLFWSLLGCLLAVGISQDLARGQCRIRDWIFLGAVLGFAGLSKYSAIFLALGLGVYLLFAMARSKAFGVSGLAWGLAAAIFLALLLVSPVFIWNYQNDWISFRYQGGHVSGGEWRAERVAQFLLIQIILFGLPIIYGLYRNRNFHWPLLAAFLIPLAVFSYLSGGGRSLPYWTSPAWVVALPFAGIGLATASVWGGRLITGVLGLQFLLIIVLSVSLVKGYFVFSPKAPEPQAFETQPLEARSTEARPISKTLPNPLADVHDWPEASAKALELMRSHQARGGLAVGNWTLASRLGWYAWPTPVRVLDSRFDQFDIWWPNKTTGPLGAGLLAANTEGFVFVEWSELQTRRHFQPELKCREIGEYRNLSAFRYYICSK